MRRSPLLVGVVALVVVLGAAGIYGFATLFLHPAPPAVSLDPGSRQPAAPIGVLSVEDHGTMEFQLHFRHR